MRLRKKYLQMSKKYEIDFTSAFSKDLKKIKSKKKQSDFKNKK